MAIRWVLCPIVDIVESDPETGELSRYRAPKVAAHTDPGRGKPYEYSATVGPELALCKVRGVDFGPLDNDPQVVDVLNTDYEADRAGPGILYLTPNQLVWPAFKEWRLRMLWSRAGVDVTGLEGGRYTMREALARIARGIGASDRIESLVI